MKLFTALFTAIDQTTKTNAKIAAIADYFNQANPADKINAIAILMGNRPKRPVKTALLKEWAAEMAGIPFWLFEESYYIVGDLAETIALILPPPFSLRDQGLSQTLEHLQQISQEADEHKKKYITDYWTNADTNERFVFNKLITGNFRVGVSKQLVIKALSIHLDLEASFIAHRLMGKWDPRSETMESLFAGDSHRDKHYLPYPFFLAYALDTEPESLGHIDDWIIEKKLDGIRGQIIIRDQQLFIWSRGEDLLTDKFPEFEHLKDVLPDGTVIDGEIIPWKNGQPLPFQVMQTRIGRKNLSAKSLKEAPLVMVCYDLLEWQGQDIRTMELSQRRNLLEQLLSRKAGQDNLILSEALTFDSWKNVEDFRMNARRFNCEGVMLKRKDSAYGTGRRRGGWWKWKTHPMTADGVLIYAQSGHGRRANLFTDYTFAVWDESENLVPFAKAYSGLTDKEILELDNWVKRNTLEKFGPVRSVRPVLVFEIAFEGINESARHKSGIALRFPRILRWRRDKEAREANTKKDLLQLIKAIK